MKDVAVPIIVALITGGLSGGAWPLVQAFRGRGRARADAVDVISDNAREWATAFKTEATEARSELHRVRQEATALADELHRLRLAILSPAATIDGLRALVRRGAGPGVNGGP